jgi:acetyl esterase/lipase
MTRAPQRYEYGPDASQFGELYRPDDASAGTVVIIHGGFWQAAYDLSLGRPLAADLLARGYTVWNLEYRRVGNGGGWPATLTDIAAGIDTLVGLEVDTQRVVAVGHSAGGHLAVWAAGRDRLPVGVPGSRPAVRLRGVVAQAGVLGLARCAHEGTGDGAATDLMGGLPEELPHEYRLADPMAVVPVDAQVLCVHSRADDRVPFAHSVDYVAAATAVGGRAELYETFGDHFTLIDPRSPDWAVVVAALPELLSVR